MRCSDIQMIIASQIAYMDFNQAAVDSGQYTVRELLEMELESASGEKRGNIENLLRLMEQEQGRACGDWILRDICNDQERSGMYACMLDTGDGGAMIAFRGSEDISNPDNLMKDWIGSDLGLLNSALTPQQAMAEKYVCELYEKYGKEYSSFNLTGHSLGGNLAEHAAITAPDSMREKIDGCVNLDGPGFSQTYLMAHANDIRKSQGLIDHYQWSVVGTLLHTIPGSNYRTIRAETPEDKGALSILWRHDTRNVKDFDENGNVLPGEKDWLARHMKEISCLLDMEIYKVMPTIGLALLYNFADMVFDEIRNLKERWQQYFTGGGRAEFKIHAAAVYENMEQIRNAAEILESIQMEVEAVRADMNMHSLSASYIKYKLWQMENSMNSLAGRMKGCASKGEECVQLYQRHDGAAAVHY